VGPGRPKLNQLPASTTQRIKNTVATRLQTNTYFIELGSTWPCPFNFLGAKTQSETCTLQALATFQQHQTQINYTCHGRNSRKQDG
jgi:hypothetical protein